MNKFEKLGLSEELLKSINELGFEKPTPIQENIIPVILKAMMSLDKHKQEQEKLWRFQVFYLQI